MQLIHSEGVMRTVKNYAQENISFCSSDSDSVLIDTSANILIDAYKYDDNQPVMKRRPVNLIIN